jgi:hypothetical protein
VVGIAGLALADETINDLNQILRSLLDSVISTVLRIKIISFLGHAYQRLAGSVDPSRALVTLYLIVSWKNLAACES